MEPPLPALHQTSISSLHSSHLSSPLFTPTHLFFSLPPHATTPHNNTTYSHMPDFYCNTSTSHSDFHFTDTFLPYPSSSTLHQTTPQTTQYQPPASHQTMAHNSIHIITDLLVAPTPHTPASAQPYITYALTHTPSSSHSRTTIHTLQKHTSAH